MQNLSFRGDLWKQLDGAKETNSVSDCCRTVLINCLSVISDGLHRKYPETRPSDVKNQNHRKLRLQLNF